MGKYMAEAASYNSMKASVASTLNQLNSLISDIERDLSGETYYLPAKISGNVQNIKSLHESIINNMNSIASSLAPKAKEIDDRIEREEREKLKGTYSTLK